MAAFATPADMTARYSASALAALVSDLTVVDPSTLGANTRVLRALDDATGMVRQAARAGDRYSESELSGLAAAGDTSVVSLTVDLAWMLLMERKSEGGDPIPAFIERAKDLLMQLRLGVKIFPTAAAPAAGLPEIIILTAAERQRIGLLADQTRFFPVRGAS